MNPIEQGFLDQLRVMDLPRPDDTARAMVALLNEGCLIIINELQKKVQLRMPDNTLWEFQGSQVVQIA